MWNFGLGDILWGIFTYHVEWYNIKYDDAIWDFEDLKINMTRDAVTDEPMLKFDFPTIKKWELNADQVVDTWIVEADGPIRLVIQDFDISFNMDMKLDENGYIDPIVYQTKLTFGESFLHHENPFTAFCLWQIVDFSIVMIRNSVFLIGQYIFTDMLGPVIDTFLNHYHFDFYIWSPFMGQNEYSIMSFDYRQTRSPYIGDGYLEFYYVGELAHNYLDNSKCKMDDIKPMKFMSHETASQWVISEEAATCMANAFAESEIGTIRLTGEKLSKMFQGFTRKQLNIPFTSTSLKQHIPMFYEKLGRDYKLRLDLSFKDLKVVFGQFDTDLIFEYTMCMNWLPDDAGASDQGPRGEQGSLETIFYDEFRMVTTAMLEVTEDVGYLNVLNHKLDLNNKFAQTVAPVKNTMQVTENEYREFLQSLGFTLNEMKKWMNDVILLDGVKFPYAIDELKTEVKFQEGSMHVFIEVEKNVANYFEQEFWDDDYKEAHHKGDIDAEARDIQFWDWKDMADDDYVAAAEKEIDSEPCTKGKMGCKEDKKNNQT